MAKQLVTKTAVKMIEQTQSSFASARKKEALKMFEPMPMPKEKEEDWRYTNIEKVRLEEFSLQDSKVKITANFPEYLIEKGAIIEDMNTALEKYPQARDWFSKNAASDKDKFTALSAAYFTNGIFVYIPKNVELEEPVKVSFELESGAGILHNVIIADENSKIDYVEEYSSVETGKPQINCCVTEVHAKNNSKVNFYHINNWTKNISNFTSITGSLGRDSSINWVSGCFGGKLNRLRLDTIFNEQGAECSNIGVFLGKGKEHIDFTTNVYHKAESTKNDILVDGILKDESTSVYRGLIRIEENAKKTDSFLSNHILKLGDKTLANSIPSLKIDTNDVKASHGATVGQIDEEHLFYLMARGLSREEAENLIVEGFFEPVISKIPSEELREKIRGLVRG